MARGEKHSNALKIKAEELRAKGKTYAEITRRLNVPKSTLSTWFGKKYAGVFDRKAQLQHLARIRPIALKAKRLKKEGQKKALKEKIVKEVRMYPLTNKKVAKSMLAMLYWAEGSKTENFFSLKFANTDPKLVQLFITLLRVCYNIDESRLRVGLHVHHYHNKTAVKKFWSGLLDIPLTQFHKVYTKKRSATRKFRRNFMGICFVYYLDNNLKKEIIELAYQIANTIKKPS